MAYYDAFDICMAYYQLEIDYNVGGWLHERPSNKRRREATHVQLHRLRFKPSRLHMGFRTLSENQQEIYCAQVIKLKLPVVICECKPVNIER